MSTKEWVSAIKDGVGVYQECTCGSGNNEVNSNSAVIQLTSPSETAIIQKILNDELTCQFTLEANIPAKTFDRIAIDWCKNRKLNTKKYKLEELLSQSYSQQPIGTCELTEVIEEIFDDFELFKVAQEQADQPELDADLEMENIFSIVTSDSLEAQYMQQCSNELLQLREAGRNLSQEYPILSKISNEEDHAKALVMMEMLLEDYDANLMLIDALSCSIARYESDEDV